MPDSAKDSLGDRMKRDYESRTRFYLPRRTYTLIRVDGRAFHTFTRGFDRPYDLTLMACMDATAMALCQQLEGARFAFVQSDEISLLLTDFENRQSEAAFDGNLQKLCSISASIATAYFNRALGEHGIKTNAPAQFDSRVWTVPQKTEVFHSFLWRQQDATRNAVAMTAAAHFPAERLHGVGSDALQELLFQEKGINFNTLPVGFKRGRFVCRVAHEADHEYTDKRTGERKVAPRVQRFAWEVMEPPLFSQDTNFLLSRIPDNR